MFFSGKNIDHICHLLNSEYASYYFLRNIVALDNGGLQMRQQYIEEIPLPQCKGLTNESIYSFLGLTTEEINFIKDYINIRKTEVLNRDSNN